MVTAERAGPWDQTAAGDVVVADQTITLGRPTTRTDAVVAGIRLMTSRNAAGVRPQTITDRFALAATEMLTRSRQRWQSERCFRWLKHHLGVLHPLGLSPQTADAQCVGLRFANLGLCDLSFKALTWTRGPSPSVGRPLRTT